MIRTLCSNILKTYWLCGVFRRTEWEGSTQFQRALHIQENVTGFRAVPAVWLKLVFIYTVRLRDGKFITDFTVGIGFIMLGEGELGITSVGYSLLGIYRQTTKICGSYSNHRRSSRFCNIKRFKTLLERHDR